MCAGSLSGALKIWDLEATKIVRTLTGHKANIRCIDFHPYGDFIGTGSLDTNIKVRDLVVVRSLLEWLLSIFFHIVDSVVFFYLFPILIFVVN